MTKLGELTEKTYICIQIKNMANHQSALKRIRQSSVRRLRNRYQLKTTKTLIKRFRLENIYSNALANFSTVISKIDKLAKKNIFHPNKAARLKSQLSKKLASLDKKA